MEKNFNCVTTPKDFLRVIHNENEKFVYVLVDTCIKDEVVALNKNKVKELISFLQDLESKMPEG